MDTIPLHLPLLMDGATGTQLYRRGMPRDACGEAWILEHPEALLELQEQYVSAGSQVVLAPTFGANRAGLARCGLEERVEECNRRLVELSRRAVRGRALVAGDLAPAARPQAWLGEREFDALTQLYAQQAGALAAAGVDLFFIETCVTMAQARAAVMGCKRCSDRPVWVSFTCDEEGRTPAGVDVLAALIVMQGMGVSAFGLNCCNGPAGLLEQIKRLAPYACVPLIAKPNAGLPGPDGEYACTPAELAGYVPALAQAGVKIFGGCCGTGPEHIAALGKALKQVDVAAYVPPEQDPDVIPCASGTEARFITPDVDVGETIECTPDLLEDILRAEEAPQGALKIAILEEDDLDMLAENQYAVQDALCLCSDVPELLERALRVYQGRAFWDGTESMDPAFLAEMNRKYGLIIL